MVESADTLRGCVALVTGAGHRLGGALAAALAARGSDLFLHYGTSGTAAQETARRIRRESGVQVTPIQADLADEEAIRRLFLEVGEGGRLDVLVNSAASFDRAPLAEVDAERWDRVLAVNLRAPHLCTRHARPLLEATAAVRERPAAVVNVADLSGVVPWRDYGTHGVSKAGLLHLTRCAALELAPSIRVNAVIPGAILPPRGAPSDSADWSARGGHLPAGRTGTPGDVGDAVAFLASADFVTGETLFIDGGEHLLGSTKR